LLAEVFASSGKQQPRVAYVGAPSDDNRMFFGMLSKMMRASGAGRVDFVRLAGKRPDLQAARVTLEAADVVYITGGDVEHGMAILDRTGMLPALRVLLDAGVPFFGLSAGSIMLASQWVRWTDPEDDATAAIFGCMGFAPVVCDTHSEGDDWVELVSALRLLPVGTTGYGIVTDSGLKVSPDGTAAAVGGPVHRYRRESHGVERIQELAP
jgi:cyanophycinase-like exopeptidase